MKINSAALETSIRAAYEFVHGKGAVPAPAIYRGLEKQALLIVQNYLKAVGDVQLIANLVKDLDDDGREALRKALL